MSSATRNDNFALFFFRKSQVTCIWLAYADKQALQHLRWGSLAVTSSPMLNLKWYVVPGFIRGYFFLEQQKVQIVHPRPNVKMFSLVSRC